MLSENLSQHCLFFAQSHTILLVQPTKRPEGRTYADYESVNECMEGRFHCYAYTAKSMKGQFPLDIFPERCLGAASLLPYLSLANKEAKLPTDS